MALQTLSASPHPATADEQRRVLRQAKEQLLLVGWAQRTGTSFQTLEGRPVAVGVCLGEALATAAGGMHVDVYNVVPYIEAILPVKGIARYNDDVAESIDDVISVLDQALVALSTKDQFDEQVVRHALALA